jgi:mannose-6-phosphate isomerase
MKGVDALLDRPLKLKCAVQNYAWGNLGNESIISSLVNEQDGELPLAELWVGAHSVAPSIVKQGDVSVSLDNLIAEYPEKILGDYSFKRYGKQLPYLLKILSVRTALSIQAHPDKNFAKILNQRDSKHYPDNNHKPEIAIALTEVEYLYGFKSPQQIRIHLDSTPELAVLFGERLCQDIFASHPSLSNEDLRKEMFTALMRANKELLAVQTRSVLARLKTKSALCREDHWFLQLASEYPNGDAGLFCFYLLNLSKLQPGEALFTKPNVLHAYLKGEMIECMANSDNVIRAGLTKKFQDVDTLLEMIDWSVAEPSPFVAINTKNASKLYAVPVEEFALELFEGKINAQILEKPTAALLLCLEGSATLESGEYVSQLSKGDAYLIPASISSCRLSAYNTRIVMVFVP